MKPITVLTCLIAAALALPVQAQQAGVRMYKCVDAAGKAYYSDKVNPDCGQGVEMNRQGVVMKKKEIAKPGRSPNEAVAAVKGTREQERRDLALLATYTNEEEIDAARERSLSLPAQGTKAIETKLDKVNQQLTELKKQADVLATQKKKLPVHLMEDVNASEKEVSALESDLAQRKAQADSIRARYEADKQRFRELKAASPQ